MKVGALKARGVRAKKAASSLPETRKSGGRLDKRMRGCRHGNHRTMKDISRSRGRRRLADLPSIVVEKVRETHSYS